MPSRPPLPLLQLYPPASFSSRNWRNISTTAAGTSYEKLTAHTLSQLAFSLTRVGGTGDRGIDLLGHWSTPIIPTHSSANELLPPNTPLSPKGPGPSSTSRIPVVIQCKATTKPPKPAWIRELEGALLAAPLYLGEGVVGVLVSKGRVTKGVREAVMASKRGVVWCQVLEMEGKGRVGQMVWNRSVRARVGEGLGTGFVYTNEIRGMEGKGGKGWKMERELRLLWEGRVWEPHENEENKKDSKTANISPSTCGLTEEVATDAGGRSETD